MNTFKEIRIGDIPCISYIEGSPVYVYVGPELSGADRLKLREVENECLVLYLHDVLAGITRESLSYTFPGLKFPEPFSANSILDTIREAIGADVPQDAICFVSHDGESFVAYVGTESIDDAISYLIAKKGGVSYAYEDSHMYDDIIVDHELDYSGCECSRCEKCMPEEPYLDLEEHENVRFSIVEDADEDIDEDESDGLLFRPGDGDEKPHVQFNIDPKPGTAEDSFDYEMTKAAADVKKSIEELLLTGFPLWAIQSWLKDYVKRSRLRITKQFKILLVDYDKEIKMGPLPKTVFLFFLRHPNGVRFSCLQDHFDELMHIYGHLSVNDDPEKMRESIAALVDPLNNSINEKCAAIKKAFLLQVNDEIAKEYYVTGRLAGYKGIILDRTLVEWECKL